MHDDPRYAPRRRLTELAIGLTAAALASGCGARSGVPLGVAPARDAGTDAADMGTFRCSWSLGRPLRIADAPQPFDTLEGAVHTRDDRALVGARPGPGQAWTGAIVDLPAGGQIDHPVQTPMLATIAGTSTDWVEVRSGSTCTTRRLDDALAVQSSGVLLDGPCRVGARTDPVFLDIVGIGHGGFVLTRSPVEAGHSALATAIPDLSLEEPHLTWADGQGWIVLDAEGPELRAIRIANPPTAFPVWNTVVGEASSLSTDADRFRAGLVVLRRNPSGTFHLERLGFEMDRPRLGSLADLSALPAPPLGTLTTTDGAAGVPLADGHLAFFPLSGGAPTLVGPLPEPALEDAVLVMRPNTSIGGVLYANAEGSSHVLRFRALTCQR